MNITNHRLDGVPFIPSPNISGMIDPTYVIMHYTAGWTAESAIKTFQNKASKVSAHLVIERDGSITQMVPFNRVAWHAGPSAYDGVQGMNNHSIGFEIVNIGFLREKPGYTNVYQISTAQGWQDVPATRLKELGLNMGTAVRAPNSRIGGGTFLWPLYTDAQIKTVKEALAAICHAYEIKDVTGHENIDTRGWKTDPGPAFPMGEMKAIVHVGGPGRADVGALAHGTYKAKQALNVRATPNTTAPILKVLKPGEEVAVVKDQGDWSFVEFAPGKRGYVADKYLAVS